jgi:hypothetical protein
LVILIKDVDLKEPHFPTFGFGGKGKMGVDANTN